MGIFHEYDLFLPAYIAGTENSIRDIILCGMYIHYVCIIIIVEYVGSIGSSGKNPQPIGHIHNTHNHVYVCRSKPIGMYVYTPVKECILLHIYC